jgi:hypothetical protein
VLFLLLLLVAVVSRVTGDPPPPGRDVAPASSPSPTVTASSATVSPSSPSTSAPIEGDVPPGATPATAVPAGVAASFARAWARPPVGDTVWLKGMAPYLTAHLRGLFTGVQQASVPAAACTSPPLAAGVTGGAVTFHLACPGLDGKPGTATVTVVAGADGRWLVDGITWAEGGTE